MAVRRQGISVMLEEELNMAPYLAQKAKQGVIHPFDSMKRETQFFLFHNA